MVGAEASAMPTLLCLRRPDNEPRLERRLEPDLDDAERLKFGCDGDTFLGPSMGELFCPKLSWEFLKVLVEVERRRLRAEKDLVRTPELLLFRCKKYAGQ
mmetsp:Transcript_15562/g.45021  ORF Transcript_15562/g.45021 Transcript_15562/m.45021 type:complete len:100 (+) Transcript_15562:149-448(+)